MSTDLKTGPVSNQGEPRSKETPHRDYKQYDKEPPQTGDGKYPMQFEIREKCGLKDPELTDGRCDMKLMVARVKKQKFEWDEYHGGGQLQYDERNITQWIYCRRHGPFPAYPPEKPK